jgi:geranylgeranyl diphosphate synthase type II
MASTIPIRTLETSNFDCRVQAIRTRVEQRLTALVPAELEPPHQLHKAIRYSLLARGKRIRPVVAVLATEQLGGDPDLALEPACAIEMVHTASLILDDLPAMDDATLRRGNPASHVVFGESTALLAAMALLNRAFAVMTAAPGLSDALRVQLVELLTRAIGSEGIIAGQEHDLRAEWEQSDHQKLERVHAQKTGALFVAAAETGARVAGVPEQGLEAVRRFASNLGLAFQTLDDLLDFSSTETITGKNVGMDTGKPTFVGFVGPERARARAHGLLEAAVDALVSLGPCGEALAELAHSFAASCQARTETGQSAPAQTAP